MEQLERKVSGTIVPTRTQAIAVRSAALVARGLRDLARDSNWLVCKTFVGQKTQLAISSTGLVAVLSTAGATGTPRLQVYDIESSSPPIALSMPNEPSLRSSPSPAVFAWSPDARYLVAAWEGSRPGLQTFDLRSRTLLATSDEFAAVPKHLAWSADGQYLAAASEGKKAQLSLCQISLDLVAAGGPRTISRHLGVPSCVERQTYEAEFGDEGAFGGYGSTMFRADGKFLATVVQIQGEWADDSILIAKVPDLQEQKAAQAQGHITSLSWMANGRGIVYCAAGQAYRLQADTRESETLPSAAELCACHPRLPVCLYFSSWLKNSAKGQLFVVDLNTMNVIDEHPADGIVDLRWSADGLKAYAVAGDGLAYVYEPSVL